MCDVRVSGVFPVRDKCVFLVTFRMQNYAYIYRYKRAKMSKNRGGMKGMRSARFEGGSERLTSLF